jgi:hypothetical protein
LNRDEQLAVWFQELSFAVGLVEPLFCTMAVWDLEKHTKLSEDFHFSLNTTELMDQLGQPITRAIDPISKARKALLTLHRAHRSSNNVQMVIWVNKVLHGDLEKHFEYYAKGSSIKDKDRNKFKEEALEYVKRFGRFKQNFLVTAVPFIKDGAFEDGELIADGFLRVKSDLKSTLDDLSAGKHKRSGIEGRMKIGVSPPQHIVHPNRLTPSLVPIAPWNDRDNERTKELEEFGHSDASPSPYSTLVNNLYFYPKKLDLSAFTAASSARNLAVEIKILDQDDDYTKAGLRCIHGDSTSPSLTDKYVTSVWYHNQKPRFLEEVKIQLPLQLTKKHHIFLTFFHINCKLPKDKKAEDPAVPVAYAFIPLLKNDEVVLHMKGTVQLATKLAPGYSTREGSALMVDNKKVALSYGVKLVSSVYPLDPKLFQFFRASSLDPNVSADQMLKGIEALTDDSTSSAEIVRFLPIVLRQLFWIITCPHTAMAKEGFSALLTTLLRVSQTATLENGKSLETYVMYVFDQEANKTQRPLFEALCDHWLALNRSRSDKKQLAVKFSHFLLNIISRSMTYFVLEKGTLGTLHDLIHVGSP